MSDLSVYRETAENQVRAVLGAASALRTELEAVYGVARLYNRFVCEVLLKVINKLIPVQADISEWIAKLDYPKIVPVVEQIPQLYNYGVNDFFLRSESRLNHVVALINQIEPLIQFQERESLQSLIQVNTRTSSALSDATKLGPEMRDDAIKWYTAELPSSSDDSY